MHLIIARSLISDGNEKHKGRILSACNHLISACDKRRLIRAEMLTDRSAIDHRSQSAAKVADMIAPVMTNDREVVARQPQWNVILKLEVRFAWRCLLT